MNWTNETVMRFLELYHMHPCIWDPRNASHKNQSQLKEAWIDIKNSLDEPCTVKELKKKKESLMSAYRGYRTKIKKSETLGTGKSHVYQPTWFAYAYMDSFLGAVYKYNPSMSTKNIQIKPDIADYNNGQDDTGDTDSGGETDALNLEQKSSLHTLLQGGSTNQGSLPSQQTSTATTSKRKQHTPELQTTPEQTKIQIDQVLGHFLKTVSQQHLYEEEDECSIFGKLIAKKMRKLPDDRKDLMMIKINQLFYEECHENHRPNSP